MEMIYKEIDYDRARSLIIQRLKRDKGFQEQGCYEKMGEIDDDFDREFPRGSADLMLAWTFWDAWMAERNQGFPNSYSGITQESWPQLAQQLIGQLEKKAAITDPNILAHFDCSQKANGSSIFNLFGDSAPAHSKTEMTNRQFPSHRSMNWTQRWKNLLTSLKIFS